MLHVVKRALDVVRIGIAARRVRKSGGADRTAAQRALSTMLADARGLSMKVGQVLAGTDPDHPFRNLVAGIEPLPLARMLPVLERGLGRRKDEVFATLDESRAAGSIGQIHLGTLLDGTEVAVKIRYPGIASAVEADMKLSGLVPGVGPVRRWGFDLEGYKRVLRDNLSQELDYEAEGARQSRMRERVTVSGLRIPRVFAALSSSTVLVQERIGGVLLNEVADWSKEDRLMVGRTLIATLFKSLFVAGEVHGDPHVGNTLYGRTETGQPVVGLMDFGCTVEVGVRRRLALLRLIQEARNPTGVSEIALLGDMGFDLEKLSYVIHDLPALCSALLRPFASDRPFDVKTWHLKRDIGQCLGDNRWWFRSAGPPDLLLLLRAFNGLAMQLEVLDARLPWWPILVSEVGRDILAEARSYEPSKLPDAIATKVAAAPTYARRLRVEVLEQGASVMDLSFPAEAIRDLDAIMGEELQRNIAKESQLDLSAIVREAQVEALVARTIFDSEIKGRRYRITLQ